MAGILLVAILSGGWVALSFVAAILGAAFELPISAVFAFAVIAGARAFSGAAAAKTPRAPLALAFGALSLAPFVLCGAADRFTRPLVSSHFRCGTGEAVAIMLAPFGLFAWGAVAVLVGFAGAHLLRDRRALLFATRVLGGFVVALGAVAVSFATLRSFGRVEPDRWFTSVSAKSPSVDLANLRWEPAAEGLEKSEIFGRSFYRSCTHDGGCNVGFGTDVKSAFLGLAVGVGSPSEHTTVLHASGLYVFSVRGYPQGALDEAGQRVDVSPSMVRRELSVPRAWLVSGWLAIVGALAFLLFSRARTVDLEGLRDGVVDATGAILLDDGTVWPQPRDAEWEEGQRVIARSPREIASFRTDATPTFTEGTLEGLRGEERLRATVAASFAIATIALGVAPVVAAMLSLR
jgi:hypothetical protein